MFCLPITSHHSNRFKIKKQYCVVNDVSVHYVFLIKHFRIWLSDSDRFLKSTFAFNFWKTSHLKANVCVFVAPGTGLVPIAWQTVMKSRPAQVHQTRKTRPSCQTTLAGLRGEIFVDFTQVWICSELFHQLTLSCNCLKKVGPEATNQAKSCALWTRSPSPSTSRKPQRQNSSKRRWRRCPTLVCCSLWSCRSSREH